MVAVPPQVEPKTKTVDFTNLKPVPPKVSIKKEVIKANAQRAKKKNVVSLKDEVKEAKLTNQSENATKQPLRNASDDTVGASIVKPADKTLK